MTNYRRPIWWALVALGVGCSSPDELKDPVATVQLALSPCDPTAPFNPPVRSFTGTTLADGVTFSQDGKSAYVSSRVSQATYDIYFTQRNSVTEPFDPLAAVTGVSSGYQDRAPSLSADGFKLYLAKYNPASEWSYDLAVATRTSLNDQFASAQFLDPVNSAPFHDQDPFVLSSQGQLYYATERPTGTRDIYSCPLGTCSISNSTALTSPTVNMPGEEDYRPVLSNDGRTLYFASTRPGIGGDNNGDIWTATRPPNSETFGPVTNLWGLNSSKTDFPVTLSSDGCTLYFASNRDTGAEMDFRLYEATRGTDVPTTVTTTLKIIGTGSVTTAPYQCSTTCPFQGAPGSTALVDTTGQAIWSGSCAPQGGNTSNNGVIVFTNGGTCTITFPNGPSGPDGGCTNPSGCQTPLECTLNVCRCPPGSQSCICVPTCPSNACGANDGCGGSCPCGPGEPCGTDTDCAAGLACVNGTCSTPGTICTSSPRQGLCGLREPCERPGDCSAGLTCGIGVGPRFGSASPNVCVPAKCLDFAPDRLPCGAVSDECGLCPPCTAANGCTPRFVRSPTPPDAEDEVPGAVAGQFSVSDAGSAQYQVSLLLPPGRGEMTPDLALAYDSSARGELFGVGWRLAGFSYISFCNTPALGHLFTDPTVLTARRGVRGQDDSLCLDGQRIVPRPPNAGDTWIEYQTEVNTFRRIRGFGDLGGYPEWFEVRTPEGLILTYGRGADPSATTIDEQDEVRNGAAVLMDLRTEKRRVWALDLVEDQVGNYIDYTYTNLRPDEMGADLDTICPTEEERFATVPADGTLCGTLEIYPRSIAYTGYQGAATPLAPTRRVDFIYSEARGDAISGYAAGIRTDRTRVLHRIEMSVDDQLVRFYQLDVSPSAANVNQLKQLWECGPRMGAGSIEDERQGVCKKPTVFDYYESPGLGPAVDTGLTFIPSDESAPENQFVVVDLDGDGDDELLTAQMWGMGGQWILLDLGDPTNPRLIELETYIGTRDDIHYYGPLLQKNAAFQHSWEQWRDFKQSSVTDYDLDGRDDIFDTSMRTGLEFPEAIKGGVLNTTMDVSVTDFGPLAIPGYSETTASWSIFFTDIDGDARSEYLEMRNETSFGLFVRKLENYQWGAAVGRPWAATPFVTDIDGDGVSEFLSYTSGATPHVSLVQTWETEVPVVTPDWTYTNGVYYEVPPDIVQIDVNGDGLVDTLVKGWGTNQPLTLWMNTGLGFVETANVGTLSFAEFKTIRVLDVDGDGRQDLVYIKYFDGNWRLRRGQDRGLGPEENISLRQPGFITFVGPQFNFDTAWSTVADVDGDGSKDFVVLDAANRVIVHHGSRDHTPTGDPADTGMSNIGSAHGNMLLAVTDGLGHRVVVDYSNLDERAYVGSTACPPTVQDICLHRLDRPLVYETRQLSQSDSGFRVESSADYRFYRARVDRNGRGWLGFDLSFIADRDGSDTLIKNTFTSYEENSTTRACLGRLAPSVEALDPNCHVFAGRPTLITEMFPTVASEHAATGATQLNRTTTNEWNHAVDSGPYLDIRTLVEEDGSTVVYQSTEDFHTDSSGNVTRRDLVEQNHLGTEVTTFETTDFEEDLGRWILRNPNRVEVERGGQIRVTTLHYDGAGQLESADAPDGLTTSYLRNDYGNPWRIEATRTIPGQSQECPGESTIRVSTIDYDDEEIYPEVVTDEPDAAIPHTSSYTYDARFGTVASVVDANDVEETWSFDAFGRLTSNAREGGGAATVTYDFAGPDLSGVIPVAPVIKMTTTFAGGGETTEELDSLGRTVRTLSRSIGSVAENGDVTHVNVIQEVAHDQGGRVSQVARPHLPGDTSQGVVVYQYNDAGDLKIERYPNGAQINHDSLDVASLKPAYASLSTDPRDQVARFRTDIAFGGDTINRTDIDIVDLSGNRTASIDAGGGRISYTYVGFDQLENVVGPSGTTVLRYDAAGRLREVEDADRGLHAYTYSALFGLETHVTPDHGTEVFCYDRFGRLETLSNADGLKSWEYDNAANAVGRITAAIVEPGGNAGLGNTQTFAYDPFGRVEGATREISGRTFGVGLSYTDEGRLRSITYPSAGGSAFEVERVYDDGDDGTGQLTTVRDATDVNVRYWQLESTRQGYLLGIERIGANLRTIRDYFDSDGLPRRIRTEAGSNLNRIQDENYTYTSDASRDVLTREDLTGTDTKQKFLYDPLRQIRFVLDANDAELERFEIDPQGNVLSRTGVGAYAYDGACNGGRPHAVTSAGGRTFCYDDSGNQISRSGPLGDQTLDYTVTGLPYRITTTTNATTVAGFEYDAWGGRLLKSRARPVDQQDPDGELELLSQTRYVDELYELRESCDGDPLDGCASSTLRHVYRVYATREVAQVHRLEDPSTGDISSLETYYLHDDRLGSVAVLTNESTESIATIIRKQRFAPFGNEETIAAGGPAVLTGFAGLEQDAEVGLVNMRGRLYDAEIGRFLSPDPIMSFAWTPALNSYSYVFNNPLNLTDPSGLEPACTRASCPLSAEQKQARQQHFFKWKPGKHPSKVKQGASGGKRPTSGGKGAQNSIDDAGQPGAPRGTQQTGQAEPANSENPGAESSEADSERAGRSQTGSATAAQTAASVAGRKAEGAARESRQRAAAEASERGQTLIDNIAAGVGLATGAAPGDVRLDGTGVSGGVPGGICTSNCTAGGGVQALWIAASVFGGEVAGRAASWFGALAKKLESAVDKALKRAMAACPGGVCPCFVAGTPIDTSSGQKAIDQVSLAERVGPESSACAAVSLEDWSEVHFRMVVRAGRDLDELDVRLLRPNSWIAENEVTPGGYVNLSFDELNVTGGGYVTYLGPPPRLMPGTRCPVTGLVRHTSTSVMGLSLDSGPDLGVTTHHPLFSADRNDWVAAAEVQVGERLATGFGFVAVVGVDRAPRGPVEVFNLEIFGEHTYFAGDQGVVAHNTCGGAGKLARFPGSKPAYTVNDLHVPGRGLRPGKTPLPADAESAFAGAVPNDPIAPTAWFGSNGEGQVYRYSLANDGTAHFSGIHGVGDGTRNITQYAIDRLNGL